MDGTTVAVVGLYLCIDAVVRVDHSIGDKRWGEYELLLGVLLVLVGSAPATM